MVADSFDYRGGKPADAASCARIIRGGSFGNGAPTLLG
ncbi:hypothetical protein FIV00_23765 [Labrenzia sp. THAF82]|nr:hypothetical protein FIV00_23765 [Labrenzia sp. THAF82]